MKQQSVKLNRYNDIKIYHRHRLHYQDKQYFYIKSFFWQFIHNDILYKSFFKKIQSYKMINTTICFICTNLNSHNTGTLDKSNKITLSIRKCMALYSPFKKQLISPYIVIITLHRTSLSILDQNSAVFIILVS